MSTFTSPSPRGEDECDEQRARIKVKEEENISVSPEPGGNDNQKLSGKNEPPAPAGKNKKKVVEVKVKGIAPNDEVLRDGAPQPQVVGSVASDVDTDVNPNASESPREEGLKPKDVLDAKIATDLAQEVDAFAAKVGEESRLDEDEERHPHDSKPCNSSATRNEGIEIPARVFNGGGDGNGLGDGRDDGAGRSCDDEPNGDNEGSRDAKEDRSVSNDGICGPPRPPFPPPPHAPHWPPPPGYCPYPPHYPPHPHYGPYPPLPPGYYPPPPGYFPPPGHPHHPLLHPAPPGERDPSTGNFIYGGPPPVAPPTKRSRMRIKTPQDIVNRKNRKNAQSRHRAARLRDRVESIKAKGEGLKTEEDVRLYSTFEERRARKNNRSRERALEKKMELDRITSKPESERTEEEAEILSLAMAAKKRKNEGDRLRRERLKKMGLKEKPPGVSICGRSPRPRSGEGLIANRTPPAIEVGGAPVPPRPMPLPLPPPAMHQYHPLMPHQPYPSPLHQYYGGQTPGGDKSLQSGRGSRDDCPKSESVEQEVSELLLRDPEEEDADKKRVIVQESLDAIEC